MAEIAEDPLTCVVHRGHSGAAHLDGGLGMITTPAALGLAQPVILRRRVVVYGERLEYPAERPASTVRLPI